MNTIWLVLIIIALLGAVLSGNISKVNELFALVGKDTLEIILPMIAMASFFNGWLAIAEKLDIISSLARTLKPFLHVLFPDLKEEETVLGYIASNLLMNTLGLGSAATSSGLKAMKELDRINNHSDIASPSMITFIVLNSAGITLFSTTVASLRIEFGSMNPFNHLPYALGASLIVFILVAIIDLLLNKRKN